MSQHYYPQDTGYHGQNGQQHSQQQQSYGQNAYGSGGLPGSSDDIPLQDRHKDATDPEAFNDHVYDDPNANVNAVGGRHRKSKKRKKVGLGQLGMFGSDKKRIPWVTYIFSIAQIAVFIGEIVNNGKLSLPSISFSSLNRQR